MEVDKSLDDLIKDGVASKGGRGRGRGRGGRGRGGRGRGGAAAKLASTAKGPARVFGLAAVGAVASTGTTGGGRGRGRGRGRGGRASRGGAGGGSIPSFLKAAGERRAGRGRGGAGKLPVKKGNVNSVWKHDLFPGGGRGRGGGGMSGMTTRSGGMTTRSGSAGIFSASGAKVQRVQATKAGPLSTGTKVRVGNLDPGVTVEDMKELFETVGKLKGAVKKEGNVCTATYVSKQSAELAVQKYNGVELDGRPMRMVIVKGGISGSGRLGAARDVKFTISL
eukprot:m.335093 g.335093  ORF g.335093 m.335093 type:complete len:279 (+) comp17513_c0_seq1:78-914(+)